MPSLRRLFKEFNVRYWGGHLPQFHVRTKRLTGYHGLCDDKKKTIFIDPRKCLAAGREVERVLLHEMCHIRTHGDHGKQFQKKLVRLAALGEEWAEQERQMYADPHQHVRVNRHAIQTMMEDWIDAAGTESLIALKWKQAKIVVAHSHCMTIRELDTRYPNLRKTWYGLLTEQMRGREREAAFHGNPEAKPLVKWRRSLGF